MLDGARLLSRRCQTCLMVSLPSYSPMSRSTTASISEPAEKVTVTSWSLRWLPTPLPWWPISSVGLPKLFGKLRDRPKCGRRFTQAAGMTSEPPCSGVAPARLSGTTMAIQRSSPTLRGMCTAPLHIYRRPRLPPSRSPLPRSHPLQPRKRAVATRAIPASVSRLGSQMQIVSAGPATAPTAQDV